MSTPEQKSDAFLKLQTFLDTDAIVSFSYVDREGQNICRLGTEAEISSFLDAMHMYDPLLRDTRQAFSGRAEYISALAYKCSKGVPVAVAEKGLDLQIVDRHSHKLAESIARVSKEREVVVCWCNSLGKFIVLEGNSSYVLSELGTSPKDLVLLLRGGSYDSIVPLLRDALSIGYVQFRVM